MKKLVRTILAAGLVAALLQTGGTAAAAPSISITEFRPDHEALCEMRDQWIDDVLAKHEPGTWVKMKFEPTDAQLEELGLPSSKILSSRRYPTPTLVTRDGEFYDVSLAQLEQAMGAGTNGILPTVASYGGTGCMGIRPGALLLSVTDNSIGWCSMAHVYGAPGNYDVSTAGHCGKTGDTATVIAGFGNRGDATGVILLDFGTYAQSHDGGLGNDWALIDVDAAYQGLVTPTMCFWGGPRGSYEKTGSLVGITIPRRGLIPSVSLTPDPTLAQTIVHYGHGTGIGAGGTPRVGEAIAWGSSHFMFTGAITWGDSGSGSNTLLGDTVGANMEAAGINTHLYVDPLMRQGIGIMGGTRVTEVGTPADGQIVPYPIPLSGLP
ncbi:MAG: S1 family peptidase [Actinomycetota bacterium]|nr:S1 family peptidase [Actinomycetota bacterium]